MKRKDYKTVIPVPGFAPMIAEPIKNNSPANYSKRLSLPTAERHMQIVRRWLKEGLISHKKAKALLRDIASRSVIEEPYDPIKQLSKMSQDGATRNSNRSGSNERQLWQAKK